MATPLTAQQMFDALKREGVDPREYRSWRTHERDDETGKVFGPVNGVVMHHTAGRDSLALCYNGTASLPGPLCHAHLAKNGTVTLLSAGRANHGGTFAQNAHDAVLNESAVHPYPDAAEPVDANDRYYGMEIENLGNGTDVYPVVQYIKAVKWATAICRAHGWSKDSVIGHKEGTRRKIDPKGPVEGLGNFTMGAFRGDVDAALALPAGVWPNQQEEEDVPLTEADVRKILNSDDIVRSPDDTTDTNKFWTVASYLRETYLRTREVKAQVAALEARVDAISVGGVDLDALAAKVADKLAERLAE